MYNSFEDTITEAYQQVALFNEIAGNLEDVTVEKFDNQLSYIYEELVKTIDALEASEDKELINGITELFVTVIGLIQIAEKAGYNVAEAIKRVNTNNLSKLVEHRKLDTQNFNWIEKEYTLLGVTVFKGEGKKEKNPLYFVPADLTGTYPNFLKEQV